MPFGPFHVGRVPEILFGPGTRARIPEIAAAFGRRLLLVTGAGSLRSSPHWKPLSDAMAWRKLAWVTVTVESEPGPDLVDAAVREHGGGAIGAVVGIGGGSVLDAAKAIAGLLPTGRLVLDHLEDVGRGVPYEGPSIPFIAVPTTAGTGSEATRNAVMTVRGEKGFKKSFRSDLLVARTAIVDPDLLASCPKSVIAAGGMDALTQLLEAYTSRRASPYTDALCESGLRAVRDGLFAWHDGAGNGDPEAAAPARARMAYGALLSGIALSQAGAGAVHGLAQPLGAYFAAPHGAVCGTLVSAATRANVKALRKRDAKGGTLAKYARAFEILTENRRARASAQPKPESLASLLADWTERLELPALTVWGVAKADFPRIVAASRNASMKANPIDLEDAELAGILAARLTR